MRGDVVHDLREAVPPAGVVDVPHGRQTGLAVELRNGVLPRQEFKVNALVPEGEAEVRSQGVGLSGRGRIPLRSGTLMRGDGPAKRLDPGGFDYFLSVLQCFSYFTRIFPATRQDRRDPGRGSHGPP